MTQEFVRLLNAQPGRADECNAGIDDHGLGPLWLSALETISPTRPTKRAGVSTTPPLSSGRAAIC